jgi:uncharacterized protein (DUF427 family)
MTPDRWGGFPRSITPVDHVEPVPRRIRATRNNDVVIDTTRALYVWEWPYYPQFYLPRHDVRHHLLVVGPEVEESSRGTVRLCSWSGTDPAVTAARLLLDPTNPVLADTLRFEWEALDAWFEEDEEVFVHPRNPYARVDALRSTRTVRVELAGVVLAESSSPVMVFETGLPTRYYLNPTEVRFEHLEASPTVTRCPYKGTTSSYWSVVLGADRHPDLAWAYDFPTRQLLPIAGLVAFYNEKVDVFIDGIREDRPSTHFSD